MWRFLPIDFRAKSEYGSVDASTLEDWPLSYDDLEPFYDKAEYELGVSGEAGVDPFEGKRRRSFPLPPVGLQPGDLFIKKAAQKLGYHPFTVPLGIATEKFKNRNACIRHPCCNQFICEVGAKSTIVSALLPATLATGNCQLITEAVVKEITVNSHGQPDGVSYFNKSGKLVRQPAMDLLGEVSSTAAPKFFLWLLPIFDPRGRLFGERHIRSFREKTFGAMPGFGFPGKPNLNSKTGRGFSNSPRYLGNSGGPHHSRSPSQ